MTRQPSRRFWLYLLLGVLASRVMTTVYQALPVQGKYMVLMTASLLITLVFAWALRWAWRT